MDKKLTINDIAELAQVSKGTVSKALNGQPGVGKATKERILKLVKQLDFHPNSAAQALASNKTENLGFFIPHMAHNTIGGSYWSAITAGILEKANEMGYNILLFTIAEGGDLNSAYNLLLKRKRVDGFIVGTELLDSKAINALYVSEIPFVMLGQNSQLQHYNVDVDNHKGAYDITQYVINRGYKKIAFLSPLETYSYSKSRIQGYKDAMSDSELDFSYVTTSKYEKEETIKAIERVLDRNPDALIVGAGGEFIFDAIDELNRLEVKIPDFGLAAFDDYVFMDYITPKITTVGQPFEELGASAVEMLCQIINKGAPDQDQIVHSTKIVPRKSCGE